MKMVGLQKYVPKYLGNLCVFVLYSVPGEPPRNVRGQSDSSTSILVEWDRPREEVLYGILRGFRIRYATNTNITTTTELIPEQQLSYIIENLEEFTNYSIEVTAVTVGEGPYSTPIIVVTDQDGESDIYKAEAIATENRWQNEPLRCY